MLLRLIPQRRFSVIFVEAADRLSRDPAELHQTLKLCRFHDVRVIDGSSSPAGSTGSCCGGTKTDICGPM
jgi:DNA invertase Pin-like site-specific DNA recombinase